METSELGKIKFGNTRFFFKTEEDVEKFLDNKGLGEEKLIPTASSWYSEVLKSLNKNHNEEVEIEILFSFSKEELSKEINPDIVSASPLRYPDNEQNSNEENNKKEKETLVYFGVKLINKKKHNK